MLDLSIELNYVKITLSEECLLRLLLLFFEFLLMRRRGVSV